MFVSPQNPCVIMLMPSMMVLGGETFARSLGHEGGALMSDISVLKEKPHRDPLCLPLYKDTVRGH